MTRAKQRDWTDSAIDRLRQCARPIIFATGIREAPYSIKGTAFIAGFGRKIFVVSAAHVTRDWPPDRLLVFPHESKHSLSLRDGWRVDNEGDDKQDKYDVVAVEVDASRLPNPVKRKSHLLALSRAAASSWFEGRYSAMYFLFGYPTSAADGLDYSKPLLRFNTPQILLRGHYKGVSAGTYLHTLEVRNPVGLEDFDGLSGSPVFSLKIELGVSHQPVFCGMALRGSASSGLVHFLSAQFVVDLLYQASEGGDAPPFGLLNRRGVVWP